MWKPNLNWLRRLVDWNYARTHPRIEFVACPPPDPYVLALNQYLADSRKAMQDAVGIPHEIRQANCSHEYRTGSPIDTVEQCPKCDHVRPVDPHWNYQLGSRKIDWVSTFDCEFHSSPIETALYNCAAEYHQLVTAFDEAHCTGWRGDHHVPANPQEHQKSNRFAYRVRDDIYNTTLYGMGASMKQFNRAISAHRKSGHIEPSKPWPRTSNNELRK